MDTIYEENADASYMPPPPSARRILQPTYRLRQQNPTYDSSFDSRTLAFIEKVGTHPEHIQIIRVLGEGAFGEVVLVCDQDDQSLSAACKRIYLQGLDEEARKVVKKEALLHRAAKGHLNVLKFLTMRNADDLFEIYLEYADGGELFDQIEPDYGMEPARAQFYFRQLVNGLQHIHACGIAHRDIKPENLLLTKNNVLKISDFGMATLFQHNGIYRLLETKCGTMPYAAPEILLGPYRGEPADIWSCGIVLVTMLVGELPWGTPTRDSPQYSAYIDNRGLHNRPWCRLNTVELSMLSMIFTENVAKRATISRMKKHPWYLAELGFRTDWKRPIPEGGVGYIKAVKQLRLDNPIPSSQPAYMRSMKDKDSLVLINTNKPCQPLPVMSFSQPANFDSMILNRSQVSATQAANYAHPIASLVRRMTRFCVIIDVEETIAAIKEACKLSDCDFYHSTPHQLHITCLKQELSFFATVYEMIDEGKQKVLVDFRLSKGDGLEFKRKFMEFRRLMAKDICKNSSSWLEKHGLFCRRELADIVAEAGENVMRARPAEI